MKLMTRLLLIIITMHNISVRPFFEEKNQDLLLSTQLRLHLEKPGSETLLSDIGSGAIEKLLEYDYRLQDKNARISTYSSIIEELSYLQLASDEEEFWKIYELAHFFEKTAICHLLARQYLRSVFGTTDKETIFKPSYQLSQEAEETLRKHYFLSTDDAAVMTYQADIGTTRTISMSLKEVYYVKMIPIVNKSFNLSGLFLSSLDDISVGGAEFETIDLSHNCLTHVPEMLKDIKTLKVVNLSHNTISNLPDCFCCALTNLECLDISNNNISMLPASFGNLTSLWKLEANNNKLLSLPSSIEACKKLRFLSLKNNKLMSLPSSFGLLTNLERIDLSNNKLKSLPEDTLAQLPKLRVLNIQNNAITGAPETFGKMTRVLK